MNQKFYGIIKLITGEEILAEIKKMDGEYKDFFLLYSPIQVEEVCIPGIVAGLKIDRWMKISNQETFLIHMDKIITMSELDSSMQLFYTKSISRLKIEESNSNFNPNKEDPLQEIRSRLENLYNNF